MICNKCQKEINDNNKFCPNCGSVINNQINNNFNQPNYNQYTNNYNPTPNYYNQQNQNKKNNTKTALIIGGVIIGIYLLLTAIWFSFMVVNEINEPNSNISVEESNNILSNYNSNYNYSNSNSNSNSLNDVVNSLSAWNRYANVREKNIKSYSKDINGNWLQLSSSDMLWVFENNTFYWYKSQSNLNDNYWYGTTKIYTGAEGFKAVGLDENKMYQIITNSNGKVTANDFKAIICTPTKLIANGQDKSNTITKGTTKKIIWILVDHGTEGIEGQFLDVSSGNTAYYFKILK